MTCHSCVTKSQFFCCWELLFSVISCFIILRKWISIFGGMDFGGYLLSSHLSRRLYNWICNLLETTTLGTLLCLIHPPIKSLTYQFVWMRHMQRPLLVKGQPGKRFLLPYQRMTRRLHYHVSILLLFTRNKYCPQTFNKCSYGLKKRQKWDICTFRFCSKCNSLIPQMQ